MAAGGGSSNAVVPQQSAKVPHKGSGDLAALSLQVRHHLSATHLRVTTNNGGTAASTSHEHAHERVPALQVPPVPLVVLLCTRLRDTATRELPPGSSNTQLAPGRGRHSGGHHVKSLGRHVSSTCRVVAAPWCTCARVSRVLHPQAVAVGVLCPRLWKCWQRWPHRDAEGDQHPPCMRGTHAPRHAWPHPQRSPSPSRSSSPSLCRPCVQRTRPGAH